MCTTYAKLPNYHRTQINMLAYTWPLAWAVVVTPGINTKKVSWVAVTTIATTP